MRHTLPGQRVCLWTKEAHDRRRPVVIGWIVDFVCGRIRSLEARPPFGAGAAQGGESSRRGGALGALATPGVLPGPPRAKHTPGDEAATSPHAG